MDSVEVLNNFLHIFWAVTGALVGLTIGFTKEGAQLAASLTTVSGWQELYTGTAPRKVKKFDDGPYSASLPKPATVSGTNI